MIYHFFLVKYLKEREPKGSRLFGDLNALLE